MPNETGCKTTTATNTRPEAWYSLGKPAKFYDDECFHQFMVNEPSSADIDVAIVPPVGAFALRDANLVKQSVQMWEDGLKAGAHASGMDWLRDGLELNPYIVGVDVPTGPSQAVPDIVVLLGDAAPYLFGYAFAGIGTDMLPEPAPTVTFCHPVSSDMDPTVYPLVEEVRGMTGFDGHHGGGWGTLDASCPNGDRVCVVAGAVVEDGTSKHHVNNFYDLTSHEFGHCLGLGHVGDASDIPASKNYPPEDIMSYEQDDYDPTYALCVSNLNLKTFAYRYQPLIAGAPVLPYSADATGHVVMTGGSNPTPTFNEVVSPLPASSWRIFHNDGTTDTTAASCPQPDDTLLPLPGGDGGEDPDPSEPTLTITAPGDGATISAGEVNVQGTVEYVDGGGLPDPTGSGISGGVTIFPDPAILAYQEILGTANDVPTFLPGDAVSLQSRFTKDTQHVAGPNGDAMTWTVWAEDGTVVATVACLSQEDSSDTELEPNPEDFDCPAPYTMPEAMGRYYVALRLDADGRYSCHPQSPDAVLASTEVGSGHDCLKAFNVGAKVPEAPAGQASPVPETPWLFRPFSDMLGRLGLQSPWAYGIVRSDAPSTRAGAAMGAPDEVPEDAFLDDAADDVKLCPLLNDPTAQPIFSRPLCAPASVPAPSSDVRALWFDHDSERLYVGLKVQDIPADSSSTAAILYEVDFNPAWSTDPDADFDVGTGNTFTNLRVTAIYNPVDLAPTFNDLSAPEAPTGTSFALEMMYTDSQQSGHFSKLADLTADSSIDPDTDIVWWAVPREELLVPDDAGGAMDTIVAATANGFLGVLTGPVIVDDATADPEDAYVILGNNVAPTAAFECFTTGLAMACDAADSVDADGTIASYSWAFGDGASGTGITPSHAYAAAGTYTVTLTVTDNVGATGETSHDVSVSQGSTPCDTATGERVIIMRDADTCVGVAAVSGASGDDFDVPASVTSGAHVITATWYSSTGAVLDSASISVTVSGTTTSSSTTSSTTTTTTSTTTNPPNEPTIVSVSPTSGPAAGGTLVTITGSGYTASTTVTFGGVAATETNFVNSMYVTARTPAGTAATSVDVHVSNGGLGDTLEGAFRYTGGTTSTSSTTSTSGSAGGSGNNQAPVVSLEALVDVDDIRNDADLTIPFMGIARDNNGCSKLATITAKTTDEQSNDATQAVAFSTEPGDCGTSDATRSFSGTITLPAGALPGIYELLVYVDDGVLSDSASVLFRLRVPNVLEFGYSSGNGLLFGGQDGFDPGDEDVETSNFLIVENTDNVDRDVWFDITNLVDTGGEGEVVLVDNLHVLVMDGYTDGAAFEVTRPLFFDATSISLGTLGAGEKLAIRLSIDQVPVPLANGTYVASFGITEG